MRTLFLKSVDLEEGSIAGIDKGFNKYWYFSELSVNDVGFVTRLKDNAPYTVLCTNDVSCTPTLLYLIANSDAAGHISYRRYLPFLAIDESLSCRMFHPDTLYKNLQAS